jgi:hypothetical protein
MASGNNNNFPHILSASSTLVGLCFVVLTSLKVNRYQEASYIDECTAIAILLFMVSSILSYLSMRSNKTSSPAYERVADVVFLSGLIFLFIATMIISFNILQ